MKKSMFSFFIFILVFTSFSFNMRNSEISQSELVFKKRMKNFIQCRDAFDNLKKTVDAYVMPQKDFAMTSDMHLVMERSFEKYLSIQQELSRNWEDVINFRNRGVPRDISDNSVSSKKKFSA